jgi:SAM-dependent methyltransferase
MITRADYQRNRFEFLSQLVDIKETIGLEIGASDLPIIKTSVGRCFHANYHSKSELLSLWNLDPNEVPDVDYIIPRSSLLSQRITNRKFDYIVLAHVLEHIADPIGYIQDLSRLLNGNGVIMMAIPDKRLTFDRNRELTRIEHLLNDYYEKSTYPSLEHIMEFAPCVIDELRGKGPTELYRWAKQNHESGNADVHCHVWTDQHFFQQMDQIIFAGLLPGISVIGKWPNSGDFNEFMIGLQVRKSG